MSTVFGPLEKMQKQNHEQTLAASSDPYPWWRDTRNVTHPAFKMVGCRVPRWGLKQVCRIYPNIVRASQATQSVSWQQQMPLASVGMDGKHCALLEQHTNPQHCYKTFGHKILSTVVALVRKPSAVESAQGENILGMALYPQGEYLCTATLRTDVPFKVSWLIVIYWEQCIFKGFKAEKHHLWRPQQNDENRLHTWCGTPHSKKLSMAHAQWWKQVPRTVPRHRLCPEQQFSLQQEYPQE